MLLAATHLPGHREVAEAEAWAARHLWLRSLSRGLVAAVAHCHGSGVVHGSLSSGTVFVSSVEDRDARDLYVKLDNFGFGRLDPTGEGRQDRVREVPV